MSKITLQGVSIDQIEMTKVKCERIFGFIIHTRR